MSVKFYLLRKYTERSSIMMTVCYKSVVLKLSTRLVVTSDFWDSIRQQVKKQHKNWNVINQRLAFISSKVDDYLNKMLVNEKKVTESELKKFVIDLLDGKDSTSKKGLTLIEHFEEMIKLRSIGKELVENTGKPYGLSIIKSYKGTLKHLIDFQQSTRIKLVFDEIDSDFFSSFTSYLVRIGLKNNTIGGIIKNIKSFMKRANRNKLTSNIEYQYFKVFKEEPQTISLNETELKLISNYDFSENKRLERIRDLFLIQCYTGLRFSDLSNLKPENFNFDDDIITLFTIKTEQSIMVPLLDECKLIVNKYFPDDIEGLLNISNQRYNEYIKEICQLAGIDSVIQIVGYKGKSRYNLKIPKYQLCSSHTARRSFITLALRKGVPTVVVMDITGHKTLTSFKKYIRLAKQDTLNTFKDHWKK